MRLKITVLVFVFSTFSCFSQELVQDKTASKITFKIKNFGIGVAGVFNEFTTSSNLNTSNLTASFFNAEISVKSIFTNSEARDVHLLESEYFDVEKYPTIVFESISIGKTINFKYLLKGFITIKGIKKRIETTLDVATTKKGLTIVTTFALNRKDFGVGGSSLVLSDKVNIKMIYVAVKS